MAFSLRQDQWSDKKIVNMNKSGKWDTVENLRKYVETHSDIPEPNRSALVEAMDVAKPVIQAFCTDGGIVAAADWKVNWRTPLVGVTLGDTIEALCTQEAVVSMKAHDAYQYGFEPWEGFIPVGNRQMHFAAHDWLSRSRIDYKYIILPDPSRLNNRYKRMEFEIGTFGHNLAEKYREIQKSLITEQLKEYPACLVSGNSFVQAVIFSTITN
jgi:hypothetical protein